MPPPSKALVGFLPPPHWRETHHRIHAYQLSLPDQRTCRPSLWIRNLTDEPEARRFHLLVGIMLTALARQTSCAVVMEGLIRDGLSPQMIQSMGEATLRERLQTIHLGEKKARYITQAAEIILRDHNGKVPRGYDGVISLPGVGPKMANLFCLTAEKTTVGLPVDTHVHRVCQRLGWVPPNVKSHEDTRQCLESWLPRDFWTNLNFDLVTLGQDFCRAKYPKCEVCVVRELCPHGQQACKPL